MKISRNWLNNYIFSKKSDRELVDSFTQLGLECTSEYRNFEFSNIVIGKVEKCVNHPNADRLKVCDVNVGKSNLQIVCGAPNIKVGLTVPVALVGAKIDIIDIKKTKIRGIESNGMICSESELGINDDYQGIMELDTSLKAGKSLNKALMLESDTIFDFDITPNRGDCFSHLGIARELSIIEDKEIKFSIPLLNTSKFKTTDLINVNIENSDICKRYACRVIKNITVKDSPDWLKNKLNIIGEKSINNIVDLANFIMFDYGQPLHVFDYDKINGKDITVRLAKNRESILCLNKDKKKLSNDDIVISDSKGPIAIAGIIGGYDYQVDENTKNILVESAVFNEIHIRKTSKKHNYSKEASKRFERGVDYANVLNAMDHFTEFLSDITNAKIANDFIDLKAQKYNIKNIEFNIDKCNKFLGTSLTLKQCKNIFSKLSINIKSSKLGYICTIPSYRNDIEREADLYEEVARVYGYNNIKSNSTFLISLNSFVYDNNEVENKIRNILSNNGFNEHYSNSLYDEKDIKVGIQDGYDAVKLKNPLSREMEFLRNSLIPGIMKALSFNEKREIDFLQLFEIGSITRTDKKSYSGSLENRSLCIGYLGDKAYNWKNKNTFDVFDVKSDAMMLFNHLGIKDVKFVYENINQLQISLNDTIVGKIYIPDNSLLKTFDIDGSVILLYINIDDINTTFKNKSIKYTKYSQQPSVKRDIAILVDNIVTNDEIIKVIRNVSSNLLKDIQLFDIYEDIKNYDNKKSLAYSLKFQDFHRTLHVKEVDEEIKLIIKNLKTKLNAVQR